jgi:hypothetical protein
MANVGKFYLREKKLEFWTGSFIAFSRSSSKACTCEFTAFLVFSVSLSIDALSGGEYQLNPSAFPVDGNYGSFCRFFEMISDLLRFLRVIANSSLFASGSNFDTITSLCLLN